MSKGTRAVAPAGHYTVAKTSAHGITHAYGTAVPSDGAVGFAPGCLYIDVNATTGSQLYINEGTKSSADFNALLPSYGALAGLTATIAEINARAAAASRFVNVTDAASYTVLAADSGKIHIMPNFTATCTVALPAVAAGLEYTFISKAIAIDAQDWKIQSASATNFFLGGVAFADTDAGAAADEISAGVFSNGTSNDFLNVVTPGGGTRIHIICDGTNWIVNGIVFSATTPAFADT